MQALSLDRLREVPARLRAHPRFAAAGGAALLALVAFAAVVRPDSALALIPTATVQRGDVRITIVESGELRAEQQATVSATNDKVIIWLVPEGTRVREGDLLIRFEAQKYEIAKGAAESALLVARAELSKALGQLEAQKVAQEKARLEYASLPELAERGFVNRNELDAARLAHEEVKAGIRSFEAAVDAARANVQRAESEVEQQNRKLDEGVVHAPRDGVVVYATTGEATNPRKITVGVTPFEGMDLIYLPDPSSMRVDTEVSEFDVAKVRVGAPVELRLDAYPEATFRGEVASVAALARQKVSRVSGQAIGLKVFDVLIRVLDHDERLKPGLSTTAQILVSENPGVLYVPVAGIFVDELEQTVVYVKEGGSAEKRAVGIGGSTDRVAIVLSGVEEGAEILLDPPRPS
ncbi:MAG TPA: efflux RND transporter periplasmic adaptor subunit [Myxococcota bacterium]|nr:efflux RND transporter periplasmic adaptor subunit [Myxococcota bacterium]